MNADHYFEIGSTHFVCQDYALSGEFDGTYYAIIADGCSSAEHTEVGAQILCYAAQYYIQAFFREGMFFESSVNASIETLSKILATTITKKADEIRKLYPISQNALQATLLIVVARDNNIWVFTYGDGVIIQKYIEADKSEVFVVTDLDYTSNAPNYLIVNKELYTKQYPDTFLVETSRLINGNEGTITKEECSPIIYKSYKFPVQNTLLKSVTICSDGIKTFQKGNDSQLLITMAKEFTNYKSDNGVFVQRCMNFLKRKNIKDGIVHHDDISCATILL